MQRLRHEFPTEWQRLQSIADSSGSHIQAFSLAKQRFPFVFQGGTITINRVEIFGMPKIRAQNSPAPKLNLTLTGPNNAPQQLDSGAAVGLLVRKVVKNATVEVKNLGDLKNEADWTIKEQKTDVLDSLNRLEDIMLLCHYSVEIPKNP